MISISTHDRPRTRPGGVPALVAAFPVFLVGAVLAGAGTADQQEGLRDAAAARGVSLRALPADVRAEVYQRFPAPTGLSLLLLACLVGGMLFAANRRAVGRDNAAR